MQRTPRISFSGVPHEELALNAAWQIPVPDLFAVLRGNIESPARTALGSEEQRPYSLWQAHSQHSTGWLFQEETWLPYNLNPTLVRHRQAAHMRRHPGDKSPKLSANRLRPPQAWTAVRP